MEHRREFLRKALYLTPLILTASVRPARACATYGGGDGAGDGAGGGAGYDLGGDDIPTGGAGGPPPPHPGGFVRIRRWSVRR